MSKGFLIFEVVFGALICFFVTIFSSDDPLRILEAVILFVVFLHAIQYMILFRRNEKRTFKKGTYAEKADSEDKILINKRYRKSILLSGAIFIGLEIIVLVIRLLV